MVNLTFDVNHDFRGNFIVNKPLINPFIDFIQMVEDGMKGNGDRSRFIENGNTHTSSDAKEYDNSGIEGKSEHTIDVDWFTASKGHKSSIPSWGTTTKDIKGVLKIIQHIQKVKKEFNEMIGEDTEEDSSSESNPVNVPDSIPYYYRKKDFPHYEKDSVEKQSVETGEWGKKRAVE